MTEILRTASLVLTCVKKEKASIFRISLCDKDNRFNENLVSSLSKALDLIAETEAPKVLVTTGANKFYSNGLDLQWISSHPQLNIPQFLTTQVYPLFKRWLTLPYPTLALINGHAFAAGFLFALCHDYRIFNSNRGFLCMNEVLLPSKLTIGFAGILQDKIRNQQDLRETVLMAKRWKAEEALEKGLVDRIAREEELVKAEEEFLNKLSIPDESAYGLLKEEIYDNAFSKLSSKL